MVEEISLKNLIIKPTDNPSNPLDIGKVKNTPAALEYAHTINEVVTGKLQDDSTLKGRLNDVAKDEYSDSGLLQAAKTIKEREDKGIDTLTGLEGVNVYDEVSMQNLDRYINGQIDFLCTVKLDIDLFSWMNDALKSTELGNLTLRALGNIIYTHIRTKEGDRAFRKGGGEEFGILPSDPQSLENVEGIQGMTQRLLESIRTKLLDDTISLALGHRTVNIKRDGKLIKEREGTSTLKQFAQAIINFQSPEGDKYLMDRGKGTIEQRRGLKDRIDSIDVTEYKKYLVDNRLLGELDEASIEERAKIEKQIGKNIKKIFQKITMSAGLLCITPEERDGVTMESWNKIESIVDNLTYDAKKLGGDCLLSRIGSRNETELIR